MSKVIYKYDSGEPFGPDTICFSCAVRLALWYTIEAEVVDTEKEENDMRTFICESCNNRIFL